MSLGPDTLQPADSDACDFAFGPYRLIKHRRCLLDGDVTVRMGGRAFDLLLALVERAGEVVTRRELEAQVWPNSVVEETSLRVHVSALRRAIGDGQAGARYIETVAGRGYCFVGPVIRSASASPEPATVAPPTRGLPSHRAARMIGRADALATLTDHLRTHRLVTIAGPGGIGKTTLALALAVECAPLFKLGVAFVDLAPITDEGLVPASVSSALDLPLSPQDPITSLVQSLRNMNILIVLDNCEHVIDSVARLVDRLLANTSVSILATSREPIDINGEWTHRLASLGLPPAVDAMSPDEAMQFPAVELFVERASASGQSFTLNEDNLADVCALTRQLDGLPLAVELVAARVPSLGVRELSSRIGEHLALMLRGRRTATPRHQTLAAMLDWSYQLLSTSEQIVLRRLSVFRGGFDLGAASGVASCDRLGRDDVVQAVLGLATKSLISADTTSEPVKYRLLDTTRAFAMRKLREAEPVDPVFRRHALEMQRMQSAANAGLDSMVREPWLSVYGGQIDDIRAALNWCFSESGDLQLGIETIANARLLHELGRFSEQAERIERALSYLRHLTPPRPDLELRLTLLSAWPSVDPGWPGQPTLSILSRAAELAERMGDPASRIGALYSTWLGAFVTGDYVSATEAAQSAQDLSLKSQDQDGIVLSERLLAQCHHFAGDHRAARSLAERTLARDSYRLPAAYASVVPRRVSMRIVLARILWLEGFPDSAARMADECLATSEGAHYHALLQTLGLAAIPIAFWRGDLELAEDLIARLAATARKWSSSYWESWARSFESVLEILREDAQATPEALRIPVVQTINAKELDCIASVARDWNHSVSLNRLNSGSCGWCSAEIRRKHGEYLLRRGDTDAIEIAQREFRRSMDIARLQGALSWELRAAMSLARAWIGQGRFAEARELVAPLYARFKEGFETTDLRAARAIVSA